MLLMPKHTNELLEISSYALNARTLERVQIIKVNLPSANSYSKSFNCLCMFLLHQIYIFLIPKFLSGTIILITRTQSSKNGIPITESV